VSAVGKPAPLVRVVRSPLGEDQLTPPEPDLQRIALHTPLAERELVRLAAFMREYPSLALHVGAITRTPPVPDLEFLRHFSFLRSLHVGRWTVADFRGLRHLRADQLRELSIDEAVSVRFPLVLLAPFTGLERLSVERPTPNLGALAELRALRALRLRSLTVASLAPLAALPELRELQLHLGGMTGLEGLAGASRLRRLDVAAVRGLRDLAALGSMRALECLELRTLKHVTELPSLRALTRLHTVRLEQMRGLRDMTPIADAPALREFYAVEMTGVPPEAFAPLARHATLAKAAIGIGSERAHARIRTMFAHLGKDVAPPPRAQIDAMVRSIMARG
jgi:hypothetical protein